MRTRFFSVIFFPSVSNKLTKLSNFSFDKGPRISISIFLSIIHLFLSYHNVPATTISNFSFRRNVLILNSSLEAAERLRNFLEYTNLTGRRARGYLAPSWVELCSLTRRRRFVVIPT